MGKERGHIIGIIKNKQVLLCSYVISTFFISFLITGAPANATTAGFEAGRIIDDIVFTNSQAMDVGQIQGFLNSKVSSCDTYGTKPHTINKSGI